MTPAARPFAGSPFCGGLPWDLDRQEALLAAVAALPMAHTDHDPRQALAELGAAGLLRECVPAAYGGTSERVQLRALCAVRFALAYRSPLHDVMFVMQGLGSYAVTLAGSAGQREALLPAIAAGRAIGALALTEPGAGSDLSAISTSARRRGSGTGGPYVLSGDKIFISNAGLATHYVLVARTGEHPHKGLTALLVPGDAAGLQVTPQRLLCGEHPIGALTLREVEVPESARIGQEGEGLSLALRTLDLFRTSVGAAALGMAQRALDEARERTRTRVQFGKKLVEFQATQMALAEMATQIDAAALLVQRAAYLIDTGHKATRESSMAKLQATEAAQAVVDRSLQLHGGSGLVQGSILERLYREVRALRIYEGTSEIQKLVIARELLRE